jgi:hypothetical protein
VIQNKKTKKKLDGSQNNPLLIIDTDTSSPFLESGEPH